MSADSWPVGVSLSADIEHRPDRAEPYRARVRWIDPVTKRRKSKSQACSSERVALDWIEAIRRVAQAGIDPETAGPAWPGGQDARRLPSRMAQTGRARTRAPAAAHDHQRRR